MASYPERIVLAHLTETESLDLLAREGFSSADAREVLPTELVRTLVAWCLDYFFDSDRMVAPSKEAITTTWADQLEAAELAVEDEVETDTLAWAVTELRGNYARNVGGEWSRAFVDGLYTADPPDRVKMLQEASLELAAIAMRLRTRKNEMEGAAGVDDAVLRYIERAENGNTTQGMTFGMPEVDNHMFGTRAGEITGVVSGSGVGKSWFAGWTCLGEWRAGRKALLATLENDVFMTYDRLVCMGARVPYELWQRGELKEDQEAAVMELREEMRESGNQPVIVQMPIEARTPTAIVRAAQMHEAQSLIIDQLTFMRTEPGSRTRQRNEQVAEIMHGLKELVSQEYLVSCLLMHQVNRDGVKAAKAEGRFHKEHMAESAEVERTLDFLWAVYQDEEMEKLEMAQFQQLKGRRTGTQHFLLTWRPQVGMIAVKQSNIGIGGKKDRERA